MFGDFREDAQLVDLYCRALSFVILKELKFES
jgi:hypothetical protein